MSSRRPNDDLGTHSRLEAVLAAGFDSLDLGESTGVPSDFNRGGGAREGSFGFSQHLVLARLGRVFFVY